MWTYNFEETARRWEFRRKATGRSCLSGHKLPRAVIHVQGRIENEGWLDLLCIWSKVDLKGSKEKARIVLICGYGLATVLGPRQQQNGSLPRECFGQPIAGNQG